MTKKKDTSESGPRRELHRSIWSDEWFRSLSPTAKLLFLYLVKAEAPDAIPGLYKHGEGQTMEGVGLPLDDFRSALAELVAEDPARDVPHVVFDAERRIVWLPSALKYPPPKSPDNVRSWAKWWDSVPDGAVKLRAWEHALAYCKERGPDFEAAFLSALPKPRGPAPARPRPSAKALERVRSFAFDDGAEEEQTPAEAHAELVAAGVDVVGFLGRVTKEVEAARAIPEHPPVRELAPSPARAPEPSPKYSPPAEPELSWSERVARGDFDPPPTPPEPAPMKPLSWSEAQIAAPAWLRGPLPPITGEASKPAIAKDAEPLTRSPEPVVETHVERDAEPPPPWPPDGPPMVVPIRAPSTNHPRPITGPISEPSGGNGYPHGSTLNPDPDPDPLPSPSPAPVGGGASPSPAEPPLELLEPPPHVTEDPVVLWFPVDGKTPSKIRPGQWPLRASHVRKLEATYSGVDVTHAANALLLWLEAKPSRKKTYDGMPAALLHWVKTAQNNGESPREPRALATRPGHRDMRPGNLSPKEERTRNAFGSWIEKKKAQGPPDPDPPPPTVDPRRRRP